MNGELFHYVNSEPKVVYDAITTAGTNLVSSNSVNFSSSILYSTVMIWGAGPDGAPLVSTIEKIINFSTIEILHPASTTLRFTELIFGAYSESEPLQASIYQLEAQGGGSLKLPTAKIFVDREIFISPSTQIPISIVGATEIMRDTGRGSRMFGTTFIKATPGAVFSVNLNSDGVGSMAVDQQYTCFSLSGCGFVGKSDVPGMSAIKMFRTRSVIKNCFMARMDYLVEQPEKDSVGTENYCDQSIYDNLRISNSLHGGLLLQKADASRVTSLHYEQPVNARAKHCLEVRNTGGITIDGMVHWNRTGVYIDKVPESSFIKLTACSGVKLGNLHVERMSFEKGVSLRGCYGVEINGLDLRYESNTTFLLDETNGVEIKNLLSVETKNPGEADIEFIGENIDFEMNRCYFRTPTGTKRDVIISQLKGVSKAGTPNSYTFEDKHAAPIVLKANSSVFFLNTTTDKTVYLPKSQGNEGKYIFVFNRNTTVYKYKPADRIKKPDGSDLEFFPNDSAFTLVSVGTYWRIATFLNPLTKI